MARTTLSYLTSVRCDFSFCAPFERDSLLLSFTAVLSAFALPIFWEGKWTTFLFVISTGYETSPQIALQGIAMEGFPEQRAAIQNKYSIRRRPPIELLT